MTHPERTRYNSLGSVTVGPNENLLPALDTGGRSEGAFSILDLVVTPGESFVRKWPEFEVTDVEIQGFNFLQFKLPEYPTLRERLPHTVFKDNKKGQYWLQALAPTQPGWENMSSKDDPAVFDLEQIKDPTVLNELVELVNDGVAFFKDSLNNPMSGLEPGEGWFLEVDRPGSLVLAKGRGKAKDQVYLVDCYPLMPSTTDEIDRRITKFNTAINEVAWSKYGNSPENVLRTNGFNTTLPSLENGRQSPRTVGKTRRLGGIALAT